MKNKEEIESTVFSCKQESEPPLPELSDSEMTALAPYLENLDDDETKRFLYRAKRNGVASVIQEIRHLEQDRHEHDTLINLAELLLRQFDYIDLPHVCKLNVSMSVSDISHSDNWYLTWGNLVQFVRVRKGLTPLPEKITVELKKSEIGYKYVRQILSEPETDSDT